MITELGVHNFKRFLSTKFTMRGLTVLTGLNGTGKSTAIQALLLARQASENANSKVVQLNGPHGLALGEAKDVLHPEAGDEPEITIHVETAGGRHRYRFAVPEERALHLPVVERADVSPPELIGHGRKFTYLCAERLGPRDQLGVSAVEPKRISVGVRGEYTAQVLALYATAKVDERRDAMLHPDTEDRYKGVTTLRTQVEAWASDIIRPIQISAQWPVGITASTIRFQEPGPLSEPIRPTNMGFGFSYALPIIIAGLLLEKGGLLIVENPEAHLHPAGQSRLGAFLARVAGAGGQVIVETHSDHVVNGIRLAAVEERVVEPEDVVIHFFGDSPPENGSAASTPIELTTRGGLTAWPQGFFDQIERDLGRLSRAKRSKGPHTAT